MIKNLNLLGCIWFVCEGSKSVAHVPAEPPFEEAICVVRPPQRADCASIAAIAEATELFPAALLAGMIAGYFDGASGDRWFVADLNGEVCGFVFCVAERLADGTWNMLALGVRPDVSGRGVGRALTRYLESELRGAKQRLLIVETAGSERYVRTRAFYKSLGYAQEAVIRDFWEDRLDKVIFCKRL